MERESVQPAKAARPTNNAEIFNCPPSTPLVGSLGVRKDYAEGRFRVNPGRPMAKYCYRSAYTSRILSPVALNYRTADTSRSFLDRVSEAGPENPIGTGQRLRQSRRFGQV